MLLQLCTVRRFALQCCEMGEMFSPLFWKSDLELVTDVSQASGGLQV